MFWDSSAVVPYLVAEPWSTEGIALLERDPHVTVWWATPLECVSAVQRRWRDGTIDQAAATEARAKVLALVENIDVVEPSSTVRDRAIRLLGVHQLRAADALQLAAALVAADRPFAMQFVSLDERLRQAARQEGFTVIPAQMPYSHQ